MAVAESIRHALDALAESVSETTVLTHSYLDVSGDEPPYMLSVYAVHAWRLQSRMEQLESLLRQKALPILDDFYAGRAAK